MAQQLVPDATLENLGAWTAQGDSTLHECTDETIASADDLSTYIVGPDDRGVAKRATLRLSNPGESPDTSGTFTLRVRCRRAGGFVLLALNAELRNGSGATLYHQLQISQINSSFQTFEGVLSGAEVASISDFDDLIVLLYAPGSGGTTDIWTTAVEFNIPDAPGF